MCSAFPLIVFSVKVIVNGLTHLKSDLAFMCLMYSLFLSCKSLLSIIILGLKKSVKRIFWHVSFAYVCVYLHVSESVCGVCVCVRNLPIHWQQNLYTSISIGRSWGVIRPWSVMSFFVCQGKCYCRPISSSVVQPYTYWQDQECFKPCTIHLRLIFKV